METLKNLITLTLDMKLSKSTLDILKNFKEINQSILFKQGNSLKTISVMKNILAEATIEEELPRDFGIYDFCLLYTSPSPRDKRQSRMPSSA